MDDSKDPLQPPAPKDETTSKVPETTTEQPPATDGATAEMPPGSRQRAPPPKREADLSSLLSASEKTELTALITKLTDSMQKQLAQPCVAGTTDDKTQPSRIALWGKLPGYLKDLSLSNPDAADSGGQKRDHQKENARPSRSKKAGRTAGRPDAIADAGPAPASAPGLAPRPAPSETNGVIPQLQELKKEALQHFKKWQTAVHKRINDISVKKVPDVQPGQCPSSGPNRASGSQRKKRSGRTCSA